MTRPRIYPLLFMFLLLVLMVATSVAFPGGRLRGALLTGSGVVLLVAGVALLVAGVALLVAGVALLVAGVALLVAGVALIAVAAGLFRRHHTTLNPHGDTTALVQNGLYRYSRNPMYLGMLLVLAGAALALGHPAAWLVPPVFVAVVTRANIQREEQLLEERFGDDYRTYRQRVRRWI
jgi:protein-S-isoprenylcysteine O-methyltransferase Ste14